MIRDREIDFELSKLRKQIDRKKTTNVTKVYNQTSQPAFQGQTLLGKPIADDMSISDGQVLIYNKSKKRWEPGNLS